MKVEIGPISATPGKHPISDSYRFGCQEFFVPCNPADTNIMEQKDYILREIEKISRMLNYLLGKLMPMGSSTTDEEYLATVNRELTDHTGIGLEAMLSLSPDRFDRELTLNRGFSQENIELLADLLFEIARQESENSLDCLVKAYQLYQYVNARWKTYSFERELKIARVKDQIDSQNI